jgi:hypothetical protein
LLPLHVSGFIGPGNEFQFHLFSVWLLICWCSLLISRFLRQWSHLCRALTWRLHPIFRRGTSSDSSNDAASTAGSDVVVLKWAYVLIRIF